MNQQGLTEQQVKWASQHDWFIKTVRCQDAEQYEFVIGVVVRDDLVATETQIFTDFQELRNWAGY